MNWRKERFDFENFYFVKPQKKKKKKGEKDFLLFFQNTNRLSLSSLSLLLLSTNTPLLDFLSLSLFSWVYIYICTDEYLLVSRNPRHVTSRSISVWTWYSSLSSSSMMMMMIGLQYQKRWDTIMLLFLFCVFFFSMYISIECILLIDRLIDY